jgi:hypothetical protein
VRDSPSTVLAQVALTALPRDQNRGNYWEAEPQQADRMHNRGEHDQHGDAEEYVGAVEDRRSLDFEGDRVGLFAVVSHLRRHVARVHDAHHPVTEVRGRAEHARTTTVDHGDAVPSAIVGGGG